MKPRVSGDECDNQHGSNLSPWHENTPSFFLELLQEEIGERLYFLVLGNIDIEFLVLQPFTDTDPDIALPVRVNNKFVRWELVLIRLQNVAPPVEGGVTAARQIGNSGNYNNGLTGLVPAYDQIADFGFAAVNDTVIETANVFRVAKRIL